MDEDLPANRLSSIRIVLVRTSHPGNIGSAARAMKNMGIHSLALVAPKRFPDPEAEALASGADDVLAAARVFDTLPEAIGDCVAAYALSARMREWGPENLAVREAAPAALSDASGGPVAFVFGNEASGLTNDELLACLEHLLETAGNSALMTEELKATLVDHAVGNHRILMNLCDELLSVAADRGLPKLDEKLYLDVYAATPKKAAKRR